MKDGSQWCVPASGCVYRIDKEKSQFILLRGAVDEWHWKNKKTLKKIGWDAVLAERTLEDGAGKGVSGAIDPTKNHDTLADELLTKSLSTLPSTPGTEEANPWTISSPPLAGAETPSQAELIERRRQILRQWQSRQ